MMLQPHHSVEWPEAEALIAEARQRARRRRRRYAAAVALLVLVATSVIVLVGRPEPWQSLSPEPPPTLPVPPDPDKAATIVAKFAQFHVGWVLVYDDGRVIKMWDPTGETVERHLTAKGLDLVRSGAIRPGVVPWVDPLPAGAWADPEFKPYMASRYAACLDTDPEISADGPGVRPGHATDIVSRLPAAARPLLRGTKPRTYSNTDLVARLARPDVAPFPAVECFEVSTEEARVLVKTLRRAGFAFEWPEINGHIHKWVGAEGGPCGGVEQPAAIGVCFWPILPHGEWVWWGG